VSQPGHHEPVPGRADRLQQLLPGAVGRQLRMPAPLPGRGQRVGGQLALDMAGECPLPVGPRRQPCQLQLPGEPGVDAQPRPPQPPTARSGRAGAGQPATAGHTARATPRLAPPCNASGPAATPSPGPAPPAPASAGDPAAGTHTSAGSPTPHSPPGTGPPPHARPRPATRPSTTGRGR